jgi:hypothetical protein
VQPARPEQQVLPRPELERLEQQAESHALVTTHSRLAKAWVSHVQWHAQWATILSHQAHVLVSALAVHDLPVPVAQAHVQAVHAQLAPVAHRVQALPVAHHALASVAELPVPVAALLASADHVRRVAQVLVAVAMAVEPLVRSVRVEAVVLQRLVSRSARNAKSSNKEWLQALVAQLCHVAMARPFCVCVAVQASKTLPTRLRPLQLS